MDHDDALIGAHPRREPLALLGGVGAVLLSACASGSKTTSAAQATSTERLGHRGDLAPGRSGDDHGVVHRTVLRGEP